MWLLKLKAAVQDGCWERPPKAKLRDLLDGMLEEQVQPRTRTRTRARSNLEAEPVILTFNLPYPYP